ncbi:hypothetical protein N431DRAFT_533120, partial [Stipitochalara longipes BDJ]
TFVSIRECYRSNGNKFQLSGISSSNYSSSQVPLALNSVFKNAPETMATNSDSSSSSAFLAPATKSLNKGSEANTISEIELPVNADSEVKGTQVFACFPKLAEEIRRMIWKEACLVEQILDIWPVLLDIE